MRGNRFAQCAANVAQLHVLAGLDAEQHLRDNRIPFLASIRAGVVFPATLFSM
jgi:hypothetical protein